MSKVEPVDVLATGGGASDAAVAWSRAKTRMRIGCLEQGDWINSTDYPSNYRDRDDRVMNAFVMEVRPPFPQGFEVERGDCSVLDPPRARQDITRCALNMTDDA